MKAITLPDGSIQATCSDCKEPFTISPGEQKFFNDKGFALPKRCKPCRTIRRQNNKEVMGRRI